MRRQQDSQGQAIEARALAQQAQDTARAMESKVGLLEGRVAETALQRSQLEDLIQQLSRSRDENVLADVDAAVRVAVQQSTLTGSAEPLAAALRQAEDRLARMNQPRLERVRRALARDTDRVKAVAITDVASLAIKLDEAVRSVDDLPLIAQPERRAAVSGMPSASASPALAGSAPARPAAASRSAGADAPAPFIDWLGWAADRWTVATGRVWQEVRSLIRVTRIDTPEAMLVAPEQAWFLRENLKLRLLNARLALFARDQWTFRNELKVSQEMLARHFDANDKSVVAAQSTLRQMTATEINVELPNLNESQAALRTLRPVKDKR